MDLALGHILTWSAFVRLGRLIVLLVVFIYAIMGVNFYASRSDIAFGTFLRATFPPCRPDDPQPQYHKRSQPLTLSPNPNYAFMHPVFAHPVP